MKQLLRTVSKIAGTMVTMCLLGFGTANAQNAPAGVTGVYAPKQNPNYTISGIYINSESVVAEQRLLENGFEFDNRKGDRPTEEQLANGTALMPVGGATEIVQFTGSLNNMPATLTMDVILDRVKYIETVTVTQDSAAADSNFDRMLENLQSVYGKYKNDRSMSEEDQAANRDDSRFIRMVYWDRADDGTAMMLLRSIAYKDGKYYQTVTQAVGTTQYFVDIYNLDVTVSASRANRAAVPDFPYSLIFVLAGGVMAVLIIALYAVKKQQREDAQRSSTPFGG